MGLPKMSVFWIAILKYTTHRGGYRKVLKVCGGGKRQFGSLSLAEWIDRN